MANNQQPEQAIDVNAALKAIEEADKAAPVEKVEIPEDHICPRCGFNETKQKITIKEEDRREYFRCIMAMRPYVKIFSLWDNNMRITMSTLTSKEADTINKKLRSVRSDDQSEVLELSVKLKLLFMCREIATTETSIEITPPENLEELDISEEFERVFQIPETLLRTLSGLYTEFEILVDSLGVEGFDENFYMGGGDA